MNGQARQGRNSAISRDTTQAHDRIQPAKVAPELPQRKGLTDHAKVAAILPQSPLRQRIGGARVLAQADITDWSHPTERAKRGKFDRQFQVTLRFATAHDPAAPFATSPAQCQDCSAFQG